MQKKHDPQVRYLTQFEFDSWSHDPFSPDCIFRLAQMMENKSETICKRYFARESMFVRFDSNALIRRYHLIDHVPFKELKRKKKEITAKACTSDQAIPPQMKSAPKPTPINLFCHK